jgi:hypothetical protein
VATRTATALPLAKDKELILAISTLLIGRRKTICSFPFQDFLIFFGTTCRGIIHLGVSKTYLHHPWRAHRVAQLLNSETSAYFPARRRHDPVHASTTPGETRIRVHPFINYTAPPPPLMALMYPEHTPPTTSQIQSYLNIVRLAAAPPLPHITTLLLLPPPHSNLKFPKLPFLSTSLFQRSLFPFRSYPIHVRFPSSFNIPSALEQHFFFQYLYCTTHWYV